MYPNLNELARAKYAYIASDGNGFRRAARVLQSLWRERAGLPIGEHNGRLLGSRLPADFAKDTLTNYLTANIRAVVRETLASAQDSQLFAKPRIYNDLLSSQPLCFNLFGELKLDLDLATTVLQALRPGTIEKVTGICFEYSPGRRDERFSADKSAFDVFVEYKPASGRRGFLGIEVKYHENLKDPVAPHRARYDEVAQGMGCFDSARLPKLRQAPLQQLWRDHLLAGSMLAHKDLGYTEGAFVVLYPAANPDCRSAVQEYRQCLTSAATFDTWTLEEFIGILGFATPAAWVEELHGRYLDFSRLAFIMKENIPFCPAQ
jgi:hypothetical protein